MLTVGAIIDRPQTTAKQKTGDQSGRPYNQISAEILFSLPICVIMRVRRRAGACSRRNERFCFRQRRHQGTALQGVWALPEAMRCLQRCNTKAKLAIKEKGMRYVRLCSFVCRNDHFSRGRIFCFRFHRVQKKPMQTLQGVSGQYGPT